MNSIYLFVVIFFASFILLAVGINFIVAYYKYNEANQAINTFLQESSARFLVFENITASYFHSAKDGTTIAFAYDKKANLYWSENTIVVIRKKRFSLLGSWLPAVFTVSTENVFAEYFLPPMRFTVNRVIDKGYARPEIAFITRSSVPRLEGLEIELTFSGITSEQAALLKNI